MTFSLLFVRLARARRAVIFTRRLIPVTSPLVATVIARRDARGPQSGSTDVLSADNVLCEKKNRFLVTFCRSAKSYPPLAAEALALKPKTHHTFSRKSVNTKSSAPKKQNPSRAT